MWRKYRRYIIFNLTEYSVPSLVWRASALFTCANIRIFLMVQTRDKKNFELQKSYYPNQWNKWHFWERGAYIYHNFKIFDRLLCLFMSQRTRTEQVIVSISLLWQGYRDHCSTCITDWCITQASKLTHSLVTKSKI